MRLLVIRTSAMGDVALTTPVLIGMGKQFPETEIVFLTRSTFKPFFQSIEGVSLYFPDLKGRHNGILGLVRLFRDLRKSGKFDYIVDLHDVLRTKVLRILFGLSGVPVSVIDKGRKEKRNVISAKSKIQLKHSVERYCDTFARAGFPVKPADGPWITPSSEAVAKAVSMIGLRSHINIGVAPYAKHNLKMWPEENMIRLLQLISEKYEVKYWLFGGDEDKEKMAIFQSKISGSQNLIGTLNLDEELALMSRLDLMIAMDSSNMHMAALMGTKVISIWGGTDQLSGFGAWIQPDTYSISIPVDILNCRPCSTFGKGECARGDFACMTSLTPDMVFQKMVNLNIFNLGI
jgi:ADP-heptose:LPS heptosyltransferase